MSDHRTPPADPSAGDLAARLRALEEENARLRERLVEPGGPAGTASAPRRDVGRRRLRSTGAALLVVLGLLLAPLAVVAAWAERTLTDTDRYVATVGPLAADPVVRSAVQGRLTAIVMERADVEGLVHDAVTAIGGRENVPPRVAGALGSMEQPLTDGIESFVSRAAGRVVDSEAFRTAWVEANRLAHEQMVAVMEGREGNALQVGDQGQLTIQLAGVIEALKEQLVASGFDVAAGIPEVDASFTVVETTQLVRVQNAYGTVHLLGTWLPWLSLALLGAGVLTARERARALLVAGLGLAAAMVVLGLGLYVGRTLYLGALTGEVARLDAAEVVFDQLVVFMRTTMRTVAVAGLVVAAAAFLGGDSASARGMRAGIARVFAAARSRAAARGVTSGPVGTWLGRHKGFVRTLVVAAAGLTVLLATAPTAGLVVGAALVAAALVALVELVARPPAPPLEVPAVPEVPGSDADGGPAEGVTLPPPAVQPR